MVLDAGNPALRQLAVNDERMQLRVGTPGKAGERVVQILDGLARGQRERNLDLFGHVFDRQVADGHVLVAALVANAGALEADLGIFGGIEEVRFEIADIGRLRSVCIKWQTIMARIR